MATVTALASASSSPVTAGPFQDALGNAVQNGKITADLSQTAAATSAGIVAPRRVVITLDAAGKVSAGQSMWRNSDLTPAGTTYYMQLWDSNNNLVAIIGTQTITGAAPIDLAILTPSKT